MKDVTRSFNAERRSILRMLVIETSGIVAVDIFAGAHLTAKCVFHAPEERNRRCSTVARATIQRAEQREHRNQYPETLNIRRLLQLASCRDALAKQLLRTRKARRERAAARNAAGIILLYARGDIY